MDSKNRSPQPPSAASGSGGVSGDVGASAGKGPELEPVAVVPKPPEVASFLTKVYDMVSDPATEEVISWSDGGGSLVVWDSHAFERDQLSRHFKHNNFTSFIRQLNTYGIHNCGVSIDDPVEDGDTVLHSTCLYGHLPCVQAVAELEQNGGGCNGPRVGA